MYNNFSDINSFRAWTPPYELTDHFLQDFLGKSDPYLIISRQLPDGSFAAVHKTKVPPFHES